MSSATVTLPELRWPERVAAVAAVLGAAGADLERVWIVGGAVRDALLGRPVHDLDLATAGGGLNLARAVADQLGGAFYPLDESRGCGRAVLPGAGGADAARFEVDVTDLRASSLAGDLAERDFTINAMAVPLANLQVIVDPLGGRGDLAARRVRATSAAALAADGVRGVRGVRLAAQLGFAVEAATRAWIRAAAPHLHAVAAERVGAELLKCFAAPGTATALADLLALDLLTIMVPEVAPLLGLTQSPPHRHDVWDHTLQVVASAERLRDLVAGDLPADDYEAVVAATLAPLRTACEARLGRRLGVDRPAGPLLEVAALFHDAAKPTTRSVGPDGRIHFYGHEVRGAEVASARLLALRFSRDETAFVAAVVRHHLRPRQLDRSEPLPPRELHRFHRATDGVGVEVGLLSLADNLTKYAARGQLAAWQQLVSRVGELLAAFFERHAEVVAPPALLGGRDLLALGMTPGPAVGELLAALTEAQAVGEVGDRASALAWVARRLTALAPAAAPTAADYR
jgi:tRNA nucleotidyltransferase/poly(A) polymerase